MLLMDEAFSALDPLIRSQMQDQLIELQARLKKTIVFITHDLDEALRLGDHIAILKDGSISQIGTPAQILLEPADAYVRAFVKDVNRARALTVETVMKPPELRLTDETLEAALAEIKRTGATRGFLVDENGYRRIITRDAVDRAIAETPRRKISTIAEEGPLANVKATIADALPGTLESEHPLAVVDDAGALVGVVNRDRLGEILAPPGEDDEPRSEPSRAAA